MYAIIETGGKQYKVKEGDFFKVEKLNLKEGDSLEITRVLAIVSDEQVDIGKPLLENAKVLCSVVKHDKAKKIIVFKYKPKKNYRKKQGHRQPYTLLKVEKIAV
jgi:large subunit ribosomal protein L21